ncbi:nicotinate-nucleotide adenylyltransferase [Natronincola ferrireducens]|uniref:Probable nicotinate-nucleotide adenylyltransferase n=1 Tax=Natronincola ferrireducens TaxID=393762 RepID=A0A1G9D0S4_9FIRM|nr:nicotinate-nucleotide adenylyltransferase [Natronincola ferrireducens]SDK57506.1 nicotinate-nucleotide adenylyltransferase [Natronincola ferrireducens]
MEREIIDSRLQANYESRKNKIGIMGGTFNPIHLGHLFIAETTLIEVGLDKVIFIPTGTPPHKKQAAIVDAHHRLHMTALAINHHEKFFLSDIEINREGYSYTVHTVQELLKIYGQDTEFYFITGSDTFMEIETWKNYQQLFALINIVVATRLGDNDEDIELKINYFRKKYQANIIKLPIPILQISSSDIRERYQREKTIKYLIPPEVEAYIKKHRLYENGQ